MFVFTLSPIFTQNWSPFVKHVATLPKHEMHPLRLLKFTNILRCNPTPLVEKNYSPQQEFPHTNTGECWPSYRWAHSSKAVARLHFFSSVCDHLWSSSSRVQRAFLQHTKRVDAGLAKHRNRPSLCLCLCYTSAYHLWCCVQTGYPFCLPAFILASVGTHTRSSLFIHARTQRHMV